MWGSIQPHRIAQLGRYGWRGHCRGPFPSPGGGLIYEFATNRWPCAFCETAVPRCSPSPQKIISASFWSNRSIGKPRMSKNPRPYSSSCSIVSSRRENFGSGKSALPKSGGARFRALTECSAASISTSDSYGKRKIHSSLCCSTSPFHSPGALSSGASGIAGTGAVHVYAARTRKPRSPGLRFGGQPICASASSTFL